MTDSMGAPIINAYDEVTYPSYAFAETTPRRLAGHAALFGLDHAAVNTCRCLEIGAGDGANLIPLALAHPRARFVGFDLAPGPVARGRADIAALGLTNIELFQADIRDVDLGPDPFDYIIANGVYAWVPIAVRDALTPLIARNLAPEGIAYVSYNALPGGYVRLAIRDELLFSVRRVQGRAARLAATRSRLLELARPPAANNPFLAYLAGSAREMLQHDPNAMAHDELNDDYHPVHLHQFSDDCRANGLQVLTDANPRGAGLWFDPPGQAPGEDVIARVQRENFRTVELFRRSVVVRRDRAVDRRLVPERLLDLHMAAGPAKDPQGRYLIDGRPYAPADPWLTQVIEALTNIWPRSAPVRDLASTSGQLGLLLQLYWSGGLELDRTPCMFEVAPGERPAASPLARLQAARGDAEITDLRHRKIPLAPVFRDILAGLDGARGRAELAAVFAAAHGLAPETAAPRFDAALAFLGRSALLVQ
jgi:ubiquinone/menaquinone biosynthesis C-methylase UbiE